MNGPMTAQQASLRNGRTLRGLLMRTDVGPAGMIEEMYLMTLARRPTADELARLLRYVEDPRRRPIRALEDVFWVLLNSPGFLFNH